MFSKQFFAKAIENALTAGIAAFAASGIFTTTPSVKGVVAGAVAAGMAALYSFVKALGAKQAVASASLPAK